MNHFHFHKMKTIKLSSVKHNSCYMCVGCGREVVGGISPQLYSLRAVPFAQEEKCHSMNLCVCPVCVVLLTCTHYATAQWQFAFTKVPLTIC